MEPVSIVALLFQVFAEQGPKAYLAWRKILAKKDLPTEAEWAEIDAIAEKTAESYFVKKPLLPGVPQ